MLLVILAGCRKEKHSFSPPGSRSTAEAALRQQNAALEEFAEMLAAGLTDASLRALLHDELARKFDRDFDVLYTAFRHKTAAGISAQQRLAAAAAQPNLRLKTDGRAALQERLDDIAAVFPLLNLSVPVHFERWDAAESPWVAVCPLDFREGITGKIKTFDAAGKVHFLRADTPPERPVVVVGMNERVRIQPDGSYRLKADYLPEAGMDIQAARRDAVAVVTTACPDSFRTDGTYERLTGMYFGDLSHYESWVQGAPEIHLRLIAPNKDNDFRSLTIVKEIDHMEPRKRKDINERWWFTDVALLPWYRETYGKTLMLDFTEDDPSLFFHPQKMTVGGGFDVNDDLDTDMSLTFEISTQDDHIGSAIIDQLKCPPTHAQDGSFGFRFYDVGPDFFFRLESYD
ncbi:hypothetical protein GCM10023143_07870 [Compostibacter hankyongensis]|uniref:Uncharacterized protein n=2 Tax=Compostibacter hankyongensis TaxID=1007089 RepID=A0ABP8FHI4_9BACT